MKKLPAMLVGLAFLTGATALAWDTPKKDKVAVKSTKTTAPKNTKTTAPKNTKQKAAEEKAR